MALIRWRDQLRKEAVLGNPLSAVFYSEGIYSYHGDELKMRRCRSCTRIFLPKRSEQTRVYPQPSELICWAKSKEPGAIVPPLGQKLRLEGAVPVYVIKRTVRVDQPRECQEGMILAEVDECERMR